MRSIIFRWVMRFAAAAAGITLLFSIILPWINGAEYEINTADERYTVNAVTDTINVWSPYAFDADTQPDGENDVMSFVKYIELMSATGGNAELDPFVDPSDRTTKTDYDFSRIIGSCRGILNLGAKPLIKLGNVPMKLSAEPLIGAFGVNVRPPEDYNEWYRFICDYVGTLVDEFGLSEVQSWRFGLLTEFENADWFYAGDKDPELSKEAYCKLYDYTVKALTDTLGDDVYIGAHAMAATEGIWDEREFIRHCAEGTNYATGEKGTRICYLAASHYDGSVEASADMTPAETIEHLRSAAEEYGLYNLHYGIDEGRIYGGADGKDDRQLLSRAVGYNIQAAYDAKQYIEFAENDIDYFSSWGYTTGSSVWGYPSLSYYTAQCFAKMAGAKAVGITANASKLPKVETGALAAKKDGTLYIMAYNYKQRIKYSLKSNTVFKINAPEFQGKTVEIKKYLIDSDANFFDEWQSDRLKYGILKNSFSWSPDDFALDSDTTLCGERAKKIYKEQLREKYKQCAVLDCTTETVEVDGELVLKNATDPNTVVFYEISVK